MIEMSIRAYFKPVETIAVVASSGGLPMEEEVEITKKVNKAPNKVTNKKNC